MISVREKNNTSYKTLKDTQGYTNPMQAPKLVKVIVSTGVGSLKDKRKIDLVEDRIVKITGQKPARKGAKASIAAFKVRQGDTVGLQVTLRGARMFDFLERLVNVALPRTKDFRGISYNGIDPMGNYTLGIREHTIFPETTDEDLKDVFGLAVTIVTTAKSRDEAKAFFEHIGFPFRKAGIEDVSVKGKKKAKNSK